MSCMNWAVPGETSVKISSSWGAVGSSRIGLENGSKSLDLYFLADYQISHFTYNSPRFFSVVPEDLGGLFAVPLVLGAVRCHCRAVPWAQTWHFCHFL